MGNISYLLKSLYSNHVILEGRKKPWYFTLIFFVIGIFLPWIPLLSSGYTSDSSTFITATQNHEIDKGLLMLSKEKSFNQVTIGQEEGEYFLDMSGLSDTDFLAENVDTSENSWQNEYDGINEKEMALGFYVDNADRTGLPDNVQGQVFEASSYVESNVDSMTGLGQAFYFDALMVDTAEYPTIDPVPSTSSSSSSSGNKIEYEDNGKTYFLLAYYLPDLDTTTKNGAQYLVNFIYSVVLGVDSSDGQSFSHWPHSYIVFTKDSFSLVTYPLRSAKTNRYAASYMDGRFNDAVAGQEPAVGTGLQDFFYRNDADNDQALSNIRVFFNAGHRQNVIRSTWINCGILAAVYAGLVLVSSGIIMFLVKRKTSIYRETNYWEAIKIAVTLSFTPALLSMIVGFMSFEYGVGALVLCILFRVIWMNNKICPPAPTDNKPLYQARQ